MNQAKKTSGNANWFRQINIKVFSV